MDMKIIDQRLETYKPRSRQEEFNAFKEIVQEMVLFALSRTNFFKGASFTGGTALRVLYGLPRFSEDLDFSLVGSDPKFRWGPYLQEVETELKAYSIDLEVKDRSDLPVAVKKAFLKEHSFGQFLSLKYERKKSDAYMATIRLEIDTDAPSEAKRESKIVDFPLPHSVVAHDIPTLFAGKLNALLTRNFVKGRDWFDLTWYLSQGAKVNLNFLQNALAQFKKPLPKSGITPKWLDEQLKLKISSLDWNAAKQDLLVLLRERDLPVLDLWNEDYFLRLLEKLKVN